MTTHEIHALSGAYAVDALDDLERARFERHLEQCAECRAEVAGLVETAGLLGHLTEAAPPPALRARLLEDIKAVRPLPPVVAELSAKVAPMRRRRPLLRGLAVAASFLAVLGIGTVTLVGHHDDSPSQAMSDVDRVLTAADATTVSVDLPGDASARLVRSVGMGKAVLITRDMPAAPSGRVYELWLQSSTGRMIPAGLMGEGGNQRVLLEGDAGRATGAGITVEPLGGSKEPTSAPIALFDFERAT